MTLIVVDVEADGPTPGIDMYSMVSFGAIIVEPALDRTFFGQTAPISEKWDPEALAISKVSREEHLRYPPPLSALFKFKQWLEDNIKDKKVFISDNLAFDWQWINYYTHKYLGINPFGHSGRRIGDLYSGLIKNIFKGSDWKKIYRKTKHDHNPVNDAKSNAEALLEIKKQFGLKF